MPNNVAQYVLPGLPVPPGAIAQSPDGSVLIVYDPIAPSDPPADPESEFVDPVTCECCGETNEREDSRTSPDSSDECMCAECHSERVSMCACCDSEVWTEDVYSARPSDGGRRGERIVCESCSFTCASCRERFYGDATTSESGDAYCQNCYCENYSSCDACGCECSSDDMRSDDDGCYCHSCYNDRHSGPIHDYGYKPRAEFRSSPGELRDASTRYFGVELECEFPSDSSRGDNFDDIEHVTSSGLWYAKSDGSLDNGCEFVSHPGTLAYWRATGFAWTTRLADGGWRSYNTSTCGIHVHVTRASLSESDWFKLARFFRDNNELVRKMARRDPSRYAANKVNEPDSRLMAKIRMEGNRDRYEALNFTNDRTVEFRIFKGTLSATAVARNLELVNALCEFVRTVGLQDMKARSFRTWLELVAPTFIGGDASRSLLAWLYPSE